MLQLRNSANSKIYNTWPRVVANSAKAMNVKPEGVINVVIYCYNSIWPTWRLHHSCRVMLAHQDGSPVTRYRRILYGTWNKEYKLSDNWLRETTGQLLARTCTNRDETRMLWSSSHSGSYLGTIRSARLSSRHAYSITDKCFCLRALSETAENLRWVLCQSAIECPATVRLCATARVQGALQGSSGEPPEVAQWVYTTETQRT